ncbi:hypothetical protein Q1L93_00040 [Mammaliicoccus sciuri]|uniref:hypothetical protein n=1 Tax=Mammaliicoccus sciuri TaxID=1296 RepID=UPI00265B99AA|nr:hypothetical protein [Mammaliicoccus sciuri]MDO0950180.1 hypothetical protein [Mammaliicoccus sciuri]
MHDILKTVAKAYLISGDLNGFNGKSNINKRRHKMQNISDYEQLKNDWHVVGNDLRNSIKKYEKKELMYHGR